MKNKFITIILSIFFCSNLQSQNLSIESEIISLDKSKNTSVFENNVSITTESGRKITSDYAEYNKEQGYIKLKNNITATDEKNNIVKTNFAEYFENNQVLKTEGITKIITSENYTIETQDIIVDNIKKFINSKKKTKIYDQSGNEIFLENFDYQIKENIFKSLGLVKVKDINKNVYEFSQIYIDTKKKEILGTDIKAFLNSEDFKINPKNKPRIFANTANLNQEDRSFEKSIFRTFNT